MHKRSLSVAATIALLGGLMYSTGLRRGSAQAPSRLSSPGELETVSVNENGNPVNNGYPSLIRDRQGNLWCAWVTARLRDPLVKTQGPPYEEGDMIALRARKKGAWGPAVILNTNFGVNFAPVLAQDPAGNIIAVWSSRRNGEDGIWWRRAGGDLTLGSELRVSPAGKLEALPTLAAAKDGKLWLAFQSFRNGSADVVFYGLEGSGWQRMADPADSPDPEYRPRLAAAPDGSIWCAWDSYSGGKYRVMVRRYDPAKGSWGAAEHVPGDGRLDAYAPDLAVDGQGRVWVVYARNEVEEPAYGLRGTKDGGAPKPTSRLAVRDASGAWSHADPVSGNEPGFVAAGDLPRITADGEGGVWVVWQKLPNHVDWKVGAAYYQGGRWVASQVFGESEPVALDGPPRRADQRASILPDGAGRLVLAYERGRGAFRNRDIFLRQVAASGEAGSGEPRLTRFDETSRRPVERAVRRAPKRLAVNAAGGERRMLYFGDLHNHLLVDDGHQGSVDQLFAIHRDRFSSDFAATTSHGDSNKLLISELAHNDLLTESSLEPGGFIPIPGFEWTQGDYVIPRAGHRHVIYETPGGPLYRPTEGFSDSIKEFSELMSKTNGMIFAHHVSRASAGGTDWSYTNIKVEPAVEMCSSWGRFEYYQNPGHIRAQEMRNSSVQDAWRMGWRLGVIGGSDGHNLFGDRIQGLTGVLATELTRPALFEAIRKRRCYATTGEPIQVDFRVNGRLMGSEIKVTEGPVIEGTVEGTAKLISVEVVKFEAGRYVTVYRAPVEGARSKIWWKDPDFRASAFYYLRVTQEAAPQLAARYGKLPQNPFPSEMAWTSPVWADK
ncbi:MAG TPA: DUF3604 domain-containing protein [Bryobacteraceae bacterium]|nr:DUF3604 domain-containing protein [Bryobacteraceae bacterium]